MFEKHMRRCGILPFLLILIFALHMTASAAEVIDMERDVTLTIEYRHEGKPISGAVFDLYSVASVSSDVSFTLAGDFSKYNVDVNSGEWDVLADTLSGYVERDQLKPIDSGKTDRNGVLVFPTQGSLKPGLYLVIGREFKTGDHIYTVEPFLVCLPGLDEGVWDYDVTALPKGDDSKVPPSPGETVDRKVLKVWKDNGHTNDRPKEVVVQLLRNGEVFDTVVLNKENNWRYEWHDLDAQYTWTVVEKELEGYKVTVSKEGITFVITNTYDEPGTPPTPTPSVPPVTPNIPKLPQTGSLWWPVPLMALAGLLLFVAGFIIHGRKHRE